MASWFTRALDTVTPWNRRGEVQRRQEKKKKQEDQQFGTSTLKVTTAPSNQRVVVDTPKPKQPENIFETLNKNLTFNKPNNAVGILNDQKPVTTPKPGTVVQPTLKVAAVPRQKLFTPDGRDVDSIPDTPEMILNRELDRGKSWEDIARDNNFNLDAVKEYSRITRPNYGIKVEKPKQGFGNKIRDIFDANTEADRYRRYRGNVEKGEDKPINLVNPGNIVSKTPVVGHVTKTLNTLGAQIPEVFITAQGQLATAEHSAATEEYTKAVKSGDKVAIAKAKKRLEGAVNRLNDIQAQEDAAHTMFQKNKGGFLNTGTLYGEEGSREGDAETALKDIAMPTAVAMLDLYTLGRGAAISEGLKTGGAGALRTQVPNIVKATAGNYASGDLSARSEGASTPDAVKSGIINSIFGIVPDVALPILGRGFKNKVLARLARGRNVPAGEVIDELDEAGISASAEAANQALKPRRIPVTSDIPIDEVLDEGTNIRVRTPTPITEQTGKIIREVTGDAVESTPSSVIADNAARVRREAASTPAPNARTIQASNGFVPTPPKFLGDAKGVTKVEIDTERAMLDDALANKEITKTQHKAANKALDEITPTDAEPPKGAKIEVKEVKDIPVVDNTVVPTGLPETPGTVRATTATAPTTEKTAAVAAATPPALPREVQEVLDNPKQYNKRQVAAARNQRKLARQLAKTQEDTAKAMERINTASPAATSGEGFVETGEFAKSANGGSYQKASRAAEMQQAVQETSQMSPEDVLKTARDNQGATGGFNRRDIRNIAALFETKRIVRGTPEWAEARAILKEDGTVWGQTGALRNYTMRRNASTNELISRYESKIYKLAEDPTKIDSKWFDEVEAAEDAYVTARDNAMTAYNRFTQEPTSANAKAFHAAQDAADKADMAAKQAEYTVAEKALKGNKDVAQMRELEKMAEAADLYQMDAIDASMLSGTGTFLRNFVNAGVGGIEEGLFGKVGSRVSRFFTGQNVGGGAGKASVSGFGEGVTNLRNVAGARAKNAGKNPLEHIKNWSTTGNQLGDTIIDSQVKHNVLDHYTQLLKEQGYKGRELTDRASVMARIDPDNLGREYAGAARVAAGLGNGVTRNNKFETHIKNLVSDMVSGGKPTPFSEATGKLVARITFGFPTAIGRSTVEGVKRFTVGAPTFIKAMRETDPLKRSVLIKEGVKQAGSGTLVLPPLFYALGANGLITGSYPKDPEERARWEREGITENSVKIGGAYYQLPSYLGSWAVPGLFYASLGRSGGDFGEAVADTAKIIPSLLPTDQASNVMDVINGRTDPGKFLSQTGASTVRAVTPGGAAVAEVAKMLDPTKNDTTTGTNWENFVDKVLTGIPLASNTVPNKVDDAGNVIMNPNPVQILAGASSAVQGAGTQRTADINAKVNASLQSLTDLGVADDPNLQAVLDDKEKLIYDKLKSGKQLSEGDLKKLEDAYIKGVSQTGDDTAYLEKEQYDTNLAVLKLKKKRMEEEPTTKPSDLKKMDTAIKRGEIYKNGSIPYDMIEAYQTIGVEDWRDMGDPESDEYDPDMYQKLWDIDQQMTKAGVSYKKGALDKNKYFVKSKGSGSGSGSRNMGTDFGKLKSGSFAPSVQQYDTIDAKSGSIPIIRTIRPNIVHKIGSSG